MSTSVVSPSPVRAVAMKAVNAAALALLASFALLDAIELVPRLQATQTRDLVLHAVFDLGGLALAAFNLWCMFLRGPQRPAAEMRLLLSLAAQVFLLAPIAFFALEPIASTTDGGEGVPWSLIASLGLLAVPLLMLGLLLRWSLRVALRGPRTSPVAGAEAEEYLNYEDVVADEPAAAIGAAGTLPTALPGGGVVHAIPIARKSVAALLRVQLEPAAPGKKGKPRPPKLEAGIVGSAFCIVADRYLLTSYRALNGGEPRQPGTRYYALIAPDNGSRCCQFPVTGFALEDPASDLAVLELGACSEPGQRLTALPLSVAPLADGESVLALGYPAAPVFAADLDVQGRYVGGSLHLKCHATTAAIAAQFAGPGGETFELDHGWYFGERGGPLLRLWPRLAAFALMQGSRPIAGPRGAIDGPYQARSLKGAEARLRELGARFV